MQDCQHGSSSGRGAFGSTVSSDTTRQTDESFCPAKSGRFGHTHTSVPHAGGVCAPRLRALAHGIACQGVFPRFLRTNPRASPPARAVSFVGLRKYWRLRARHPSSLDTATDNGFRSFPSAPKPPLGIDPAETRSNWPPAGKYWCWYFVPKRCSYPRVVICRCRRASGFKCREGIRGYGLDLYHRRRQVWIVGRVSTISVPAKNCIVLFGNTFSAEPLPAFCGHFTRPWPKILLRSLLDRPDRRPMENRTS